MQKIFLYFIMFAFIINTSSLNAATNYSNISNALANAPVDVKQDIAADAVPYFAHETEELRRNIINLAQINNTGFNHKDLKPKSLNLYPKTDPKIFAKLQSYNFFDKNALFISFYKYKSGSEDDNITKTLGFYPSASAYHTDTLVNNIAQLAQTAPNYKTLKLLNAILKSPYINELAHIEALLAAAQISKEKILRGVTEEERITLQNNLARELVFLDNYPNRLSAITLQSDKALRGRIRTTIHLLKGSKSKHFINPENILPIKEATNMIIETANKAFLAGGLATMASRFIIMGPSAGIVVVSRPIKSIKTVSPKKKMTINLNNTNPPTEIPNTKLMPTIIKKVLPANKIILNANAPQQASLSIAKNMKQSNLRDAINNKIKTHGKKSKLTASQNNLEKLTPISFQEITKSVFFVNFDGGGSGFVIEMYVNGKNELWGITAGHSIASPYMHSPFTAVFRDRYAQYIAHYPITPVETYVDQLYQRGLDITIFKFPEGTPIAKYLEQQGVIPLPLSHQPTNMDEHLYSYGYSTFNQSPYYSSDRYVHYIGQNKYVTDFSFWRYPLDANHQGYCGAPILNNEGKIVAVHKGSNLLEYSSYAHKIDYIAALQRGEDIRAPLMINGKQIGDIGINEAISDVYFKNTDGTYSAKDKYGQKVEPIVFHSLHKLRGFKPNTPLILDIHNTVTGQMRQIKYDYK